VGRKPARREGDGAVRRASRRVRIPNDPTRAPTRTSRTRAGRAGPSAPSSGSTRVGRYRLAIVTSRRGAITFCFYPSADLPPRPPIPFPNLKNSAVQTNAKYGDESVYFDLGDVESTVGSWDVYGVESKARYPDQQEKFFEQAAQGLGRREAMYSFLALAGPAACLVFGAKGSKDAKLPITVGPQKEPQLGPRDRL